MSRSDPAATATSHPAPPGVEAGEPDAIGGASGPEQDVASLWAALGEVLDPEYPISVVDMGLIYGIRRAGGRVEVDLTFTATACPCMAFIEEDVRERLRREPGVDDVVLHVVWDPPWTRDRMSEKGKEILRRYGVAA